MIGSGWGMGEGGGCGVGAMWMGGGGGGWKMDRKMTSSHRVCIGLVYLSLHPSCGTLHETIYDYAMTSIPPCSSPRAPAHPATHHGTLYEVSHTEFTGAILGRF